MLRCRRSTSRLAHCRPGDRIARPEYTGRDDGCDRVRRVMQPVEEVKGKGYEDESDEDRQADSDGIHRDSPSELIDDQSIDLVRHVLQSIDHLFEMIIKLIAHDVVHGIAASARKEQRLAALVV